MASISFSELNGFTIHPVSRAKDRMRSHDADFVPVKRVFFQQDRVGNADFSDIAQHGGLRDLPYAVPRKRTRSGQRLQQQLDVFFRALQVIARFEIPELRGHDECVQDFVSRGPEPIRSVFQLFLDEDARLLRRVHPFEFQCVIPDVVGVGKGFPLDADQPVSRAPEHGAISVIGVEDNPDSESTIAIPREELASD